MSAAHMVVARDSPPIPATAAREVLLSSLVVVLVGSSLVVVAAAVGVMVPPVANVPRLSPAGAPAPRNASGACAGASGVLLVVGDAGATGAPSVVARGVVVALELVLFTTGPL